MDLDREHKKVFLKEILKQLHGGLNVNELKEKFRSLLSHVTSTEITEMEEELIKEGIKREDIIKLCDLHIELFRESIEKESVLAPKGHPINILMEEHSIFITKAKELKNNIDCFVESKDKKHLEKVDNLILDLKSTDSHYIREENVLFPYLEKHGITEPPKMMWTEHDAIRAIKKEIYNYYDSIKVGRYIELEKLKGASFRLVEMLSTHFYKENNILFPASMRTIDELEWQKIRKEFDELGYAFVKPPKLEEQAILEKVELEEERMVKFETGNLFFDEIEAIFNTLPVDITFVDKDDKVSYFSETRERIFVRTPAIIGRKVQQCHPEKSIDIVNRILTDFKNGSRDSAEFWITLNDRFILIRYYAVRNKKGTYLGCLEVTQDITDIKKLSGEKRLLND